MYSGKPRNFLKEIDQYIVSQVQSLKDHAIAVKKHFKHNDYISFRSALGNCFVKIYGLKNDTKNNSNQLRNQFQQVCLQLTDKFLYSSLRAKSVKVFMRQNYC
jgi:ATP-dependent protease Clp ATPase subunit